MANKIEPLRRGECGLAHHKYQRYDATVKQGTEKGDLTNPDLWVNVAAPFNAGDEIRVRCEDDSFTALLYVTFSVSNKVRLKMIYFVELEDVDHDKLSEGLSDYQVKLCGAKKFCIQQISTGEFIKENIPTKLEAEKELDDLLKALAR